MRKLLARLLPIALALGLPLSALPMAATSVDYPTGTFSSGTLGGSFTGGGMVDASIVGSLNTIDISTGALTAFTVGCPAGSTCFSFSSGMVDVGPAGSIFKDAITGGITISASGSGAISAVLASVNGISAGTATATFDFANGKILSGSEDVSFNRAVATPEPASLFLLGTGLLGLVVAARRKLRSLGAPRPLS